MPARFLTARWKYLAMLSYVAPPEILEPHLPKGTELDLFNGQAMMSMVGFMFLDTKLKGIPVPFHRNFEEVNLRFYVRRVVDGELRRGVVFIKELVPRRALAWVARTVYNESYVALPMDHRLDTDGETPRGPVSYGWTFEGKRHHMTLTPIGAPALPEQDSEAAFITEHYWGYAVQKDGGTVEYRVTHPPWQVWETMDPEFDCEPARLYGEAFAAPLAAKPTSALLALGSEVTVYAGARIV